MKQEAPTSISRSSSLSYKKGRFFFKFENLHPLFMVKLLNICTLTNVGV
ncbi:hypothetical protein BLAHAN_05288 [Blautia hansenii DSM 20583]|uniref:Uncharacterized protein n=1 Tax=Blautia hansenii DSM 20583 TaxID=537007 RepID=C9L7C5_BLAHA|nr:hypothetical protein BLAHAN_05288 [Blautia hansenii DSM 20583]